MAKPDAVAKVHGTWRTIGLAAVALCVALAGCGSDSDSDADSTSTTTTTTEAGKAAVCTARDDLEQSVGDLGDLSVTEEGKSGVEAALLTVGQDFEELQSVASDTYKPQIDDVESALSDLDTAVGNLGSGDLGQETQDVGAAISQVSETTTTLVTTLEEECPSG